MLIFLFTLLGCEVRYLVVTRKKESYVSIAELVAHRERVMVSMFQYAHLRGAAVRSDGLTLYCNQVSGTLTEKKIPQHDKDCG